MYVGDLAQQTRLCTVRDWEQVGEQFIEERKVILQKHYRSTKELLEYLAELGYAVEIPASIKKGEPVKEYIAAASEDEIKTIRELAAANPKTVIGVIAKLPKYLLPCKAWLAKMTKVHILTINEAQGVEFDIVCLVGMHEDFFIAGYSDEALRREKERVNRDLLYVALTRAMSELHVFGKKNLSEIVK